MISGGNHYYNHSNNNYNNNNSNSNSGYNYGHNRSRSAVNVAGVPLRPNPNRYIISIFTKISYYELTKQINNLEIIIEVEVLHFLVA